jgi:thiazole synthase
MTLTLYGKPFKSRLLLGTARYPSPEHIARAVHSSGSEIVTVSLRRESSQAALKKGNSFWTLIKQLNVTVLPNTAGCASTHDALVTAHMARDVFQTDWIKLEVIGDEASLAPDPFSLLEAARVLCQDGFHVFPYMTDDLVLAKKLVDVGCGVLMPWGAPIGSARGLNDPYAIRLLRQNFPDIPLIVDAGIGRPSHAAQAMEFGIDALLVNTAVALAADPPQMALAMAKAVEAGYLGYHARMLEPQSAATASSPTFGAFSSPWA